MNQQHQVVRAVHVASLLGVSLLAQACHADDTLEPPRALEVASVSASSGELGEDPFMLDLAREIPGFGGIYYEPGGDRMVITLTEAASPDFSVARQAVRRKLTAEPDPLSIENALAVQFVDRVVEYSFIELAEHRARLRPHVFAISGVGGLQVDEVSNRITVGLLDLSAASLVQELATELAIPLDMISFMPDSPADRLYMSAEETYEPSSLVPTLLDPISVPDNRLRGGYRVRGGKTCTLGFSALRVPGHPWQLPLVVSNSHCSHRPFEPDGGHWGQPTSADTIGWEDIDALPTRKKCVDNDYRGSHRGVNRGCAYSDATSVATFRDYGPFPSTLREIALGEIGRTDDRSNCRDCEASKTIDLSNPIIPIKGVLPRVFAHHTELDKVGITTGWTYGVVRHTCYDKWDGFYRLAVLCNDIVEMPVYHGDSGSPVFQYSEESGSAYLWGILWAGNNHGRDPYPIDPVDMTRRAYRFAFVSRMEYVRKSLGDLVVAGPPSVDSIIGPVLVDGNARCTWAGYASGSKPLSYEWTGVVSGSGWRISGIATESGSLTLTITDRIGRTARKAIGVLVDPDTDPPCGAGQS